MKGRLPLAAQDQWHIYQQFFIQTVLGTHPIKDTTGGDYLNISGSNDQPLVPKIMPILLLLTKQISSRDRLVSGLSSHGNCWQRSL